MKIKCFFRIHILFELKKYEFINSKFQTKTINLNDKSTTLRGIESQNRRRRKRIDHMQMLLFKVRKNAFVF